MPIKKKTKTPSSRKRKTQSTKKGNKIVKTKEKEIFINDMNKTIHDLGRLPRLLILPIIVYIEKKYNNIPENRRKKLTNIIKKIKTNGMSAVGELKERFQGILRHDKTSVKKAQKRNTKKVAARKRNIKKKTISKNSTIKRKSTTKLTTKTK